LTHTFSRLLPPFIGDLSPPALSLTHSLARSLSLSLSLSLSPLLSLPLSLSVGLSKSSSVRNSKPLSLPPAPFFPFPCASLPLDFPPLSPSLSLSLSLIHLLLLALSPSLLRPLSRSLPQFSSDQHTHTNTHTHTHTAGGNTQQAGWQKRERDRKRGREREIAGACARQQLLSWHSRGGIAQNRIQVRYLFLLPPMLSPGARFG